VDGLQEWADDYQQNIKRPLHYDWTAWRTRGLDIAQRIAELLPPTAALYYLADGAISFETYGDDATPYMRIAGNVTRIV
ncbi:MAG: hypothetical protein K2O53_03735, partial [Bacteroidales bacterium]|nr:hypothetical protein [Bacteroidales bacterium]